MTQSVNGAIWQRVGAWLPPAVWNLAGDYLGDRECSERLDRVLPEGSKSEAFRQKRVRYEVEYERNLRIFWGSLLYGELRVNFLIGTRPTVLSRLTEMVNGAKPDLKASMKEDEYALLTKSVAQRECPAGVSGDLIRRVVRHKSMGPLLSLVDSMKYQPVHFEIQKEVAHSTFVVRELGVLTKLTRLTFEKANKLEGPVDLTNLVSLEFLDIQKSGLKLSDLRLAHRIRVWADELQERPQEVGPPAKEKRFRPFHSA